MFTIKYLFYLGEKYIFTGNSNILNQHLRNLNLHQAPLVNVPQIQGNILL